MSNKQKQRAANKRAAPKKSASSKRRGDFKPANNNKATNIANSSRNQSAANAYFSGTSVSRPQFQSMGGTDGRIRVRHKELFDDLSGSIFFSLKKFPINPGRPEIFPWLSQISQNYESYRFNKLRFEFKTLAPTATQGTVALSVDYDAADAAPTSLQEMFQNQGTVDSAAWAPTTCLNCPVSNMDKLKQRYIRGNTALSANLDIKTYDVGNFFIATADMTGVAKVGRLWVEYDVELMTPQGRSVDPDYSAHVTASGTISLVNPLGTTQILGANSVMPLGIGPAGATLGFTFNGEYLLSFSYTGTGLVGITFLAQVGLPQFTLLNSFINVGATAGTQLVKIAGIENDVLAVITTGNTTITGMQFWLAPFNYQVA